MKRVILVAVCVMLAGCDYTVLLVKTPEIDIDKSVVGLWERSKNDGQTESLLILPLNKHEYMVSYPAGSKNAMFARGLSLERFGHYFGSAGLVRNRSGRIAR